MAAQISQVAQKCSKNKVLVLIFGGFREGPSAKTPPGAFLVTICAVSGSM
jgi:hypothetical protein